MGNKVITESLPPSSTPLVTEDLDELTRTTTDTVDEASSLLLTKMEWLIGWEIMIDGLGHGQIRDILGTVDDLALCLVELKDGRKCIVPTALEYQNDTSNDTLQKETVHLNILSPP